MAIENVPFKVNVRQNKNESSSSFGKYFAEPDENKALSLKGFARHMSEHGKLATYDMLVLVLQNVVSCMTELIAQGQPVKLDGLGTFRPTISNYKGGVNSIEEAATKGADGMIEGVNLAFYPENSKGEKLTSKEFKKKCVFELAYVVECKKKTIEGKERTYQEKIPFSSFAIATYAGGSTPSGGSGSGTGTGGDNGGSGTGGNTGGNTGGGGEVTGDGDGD